MLSIRRLVLLAALALVLSGCDAADLSSVISASPVPGGAPGPVVLGRATPAPAGQPQWGQRTKTSGCTVDGPFPDSACSPGDVFPQATKDAICTPGYSRSVRDVPVAVKDAVYAEYGIASRTPGQYEVDHLVSLELGGSNDISNLWPEAAVPKPGFHEKDEVENALHDQVCSGQLDLATAQRQIATDWLSVYDQLHGLPASAHVPSSSAAQPAPAATAVPPAAQGRVPSSDGACPQDLPIKGNIRSDGTKIYHSPNDPSYARTHAEQCFATEADAQAAGFRAPR